MKKGKKKFLLTAAIVGLMLTIASCTNMYDPENDEHLIPNELAAELYTQAPTESSTEKPTETPTPKPTQKPTPKPTQKPTPKPTETPTPAPTETPETASERVDRILSEVNGYKAPKNWKSKYPQGSAGKLEGTVLYVSIFASESTHVWKEDDQNIVDTIYNDLSIASDFLVDQAASYGKELNIIWDWKEFHQLYYETTLDVKFKDILTENGTLSNAVWAYIEKNVNSEGLRQAFEADSVVYMVYLRSDKGNTQPSCTRDFYDWMPYPYEICYIQANNRDGLVPPSVIAHESLHAFSAPDLYWTTSYSAFSLANGITQDFINYIDSIELNDIMRYTWHPRTYKYLYDSICQEITPITAYYVGLIDQCDLVDDWGLEKSEFVQ